jgi:hypothetical protein
VQNQTVKFIDSETRYRMPSVILITMFGCLIEAFKGNPFSQVDVCSETVAALTCAALFCVSKKLPNIFTYSGEIVFTTYFISHLISSIIFHRIASKDNEAYTYGLDNPNFDSI